MEKNITETVYYNDSIKKEYVKFKKSKADIPSYFLEKFFATVSKEEEIHQKDVATWSKAEILNYYKSLAIKSYDAMTNIHSQLSQYACWYKETVGTEHNSFAEITGKEAGECTDSSVRTKSMLTRVQVLTLIKEFFNPSDAFLFLGLFEFGNSNDFGEFINLTVEDLDEETNTIRLKGNGDAPERTVTVSPELMRLAIASHNTHEYHVIGGGKDIVFLPSNKIFKDMPNASTTSSDFQKGRRLYIRMKKIRQDLNMTWLSAKALSDAGIVHDVVKMAKEQELPAKVVLTIPEFHENLEKKHNKQINTSQFCAKYKDVLKKRIQSNNTDI